MKLTQYSRNKILETFKRWDVPKEFADPMYNYLVHGFSPGSCFTSVLANDFAGAIQRSHPSNTVEAFKALAGWIGECIPPETKGSYNDVEIWCSLPADVRRSILEDCEIIYTTEEEIMMTLQSKPTIEPVLY
jgi:hypothetical protein